MEDKYDKAVAIGVTNPSKAVILLSALGYYIISSIEI